MSLVRFDRFVVGSAYVGDALVVERIRFVFACQPEFVLVGPDLRPLQKLINPAPTDRLEDLLCHQMQTEFTSAPSGDRSFVFFGSSQAVLKIAACCSAVTRGGRPLRLRSDSSFVISASKTCRSSLHSMSINRSQLSRHLRRQRPTASCCKPTRPSISSLLWPSNAKRMILLRWASATLVDLDFANV